MDAKDSAKSLPINQNEFSIPISKSNSAALFNFYVFKGDLTTYFQFPKLKLNMDSLA